MSLSAVIYLIFYRNFNNLYLFLRLAVGQTIGVQCNYCPSPLYATHAGHIPRLSPSLYRELNS